MPLLRSPDCAAPAAGIDAGDLVQRFHIVKQCELMTSLVKGGDHTSEISFQTSNQSPMIVGHQYPQKRRLQIARGSVPLLASRLSAKRANYVPEIKSFVIQEPRPS